jgi:hypothetical protein
MKKTLLLLLSMCIASVAYAQNVSITPTGITPAQGGSVQKLSYDAIKALPSPQRGDQAYDITYNTMRFYNGQRWVDGQVNHPYKPSLTGFRVGTTLGINKTKIDTLGNIYVVGNFSGSISFGATTLTSAGGVDIFIAKYLPNETLSWVIKIGGTLDENFKDLEIGEDNNLYLTGTYKGTMLAGALTRTNADASGLTTDVFLTKISPSNAIVWLTGQGNINNDEVTSIALDNSNNSYIVGSFIGSITEGLATMTSAGLEDIFIKKSNSFNGGTTQLLRAGGSGSDLCLDILVLDTDNSLYLTGYFSGTAAFGSTSLVSAGGLDAFIAKYDQTLNLWDSAFSGGGSGEDMGKALTTNNTTNIFLTGTFNTVANLFGQSRTSSGNKDVFIAKFNPILAPASGVFKLGDNSNDDVNDILFISLNNVYICGNYLSNSTSLSDASFAQVSTQNKGYILQIDFLLNTVIWSETFLSKSNNTIIYNLAEGLNQALYASGFTGAELILGGKSISSNFITKLER